MQTINVEVPNGYKAEWINNVLTLVEEKPIEYKFKIGDEVRAEGQYYVYTITKRIVIDGEPGYEISNGWGISSSAEKWLALAAQDITERIKTFDDAVKWCVENGKREMLRTYSLIFNGLLNSESEITEDVDDIIAYLKLRIITCALNEEWEPTFTEDEERWRVVYDAVDDSYDFGCSLRWETAPNKLLFKSERLAEYAATQFADIYADFCGCKKGGEQ